NEEKNDLKKGGIFNPKNWNEYNFKKYFSDIQVTMTKAAFKNPYEDTNFDYILENKIEDALYDSDLDDEEKIDLKRFRKKGFFNLSSWNENNFKKYFGDVDVKTYGVFKILLEMKMKQDQERKNDIYYKYKKLSRDHEILLTKYNEF
ncbi:1114_t:CDS:2, partial [Scutellospora calospora]